MGINCFYFSNLLEKTSDGILKAAKLGDLKTVSGIVKFVYVIVYFYQIYVQFSGMPLIPLIFNLLTPNVNYCGRTAPLTSKVPFYIFIKKI